MTRGTRLSALRVVLPACAWALAVVGCSGPGESGSRKTAAVQPRRFADVDEERLAHADREPQNWYTTNRSSGSDHFSPLGEIDQNNVSSLGFAWQYKTQTTRGLEASPLVI